MANLSLTTKELEKILKFISGTTVAIGVVVGLVRHFAFDADPAPALLVGLLSAVGYAVTAGMFLLKRPWRSRRLAQWTGRPLVQGVWVGQLTSDYRDKNGRPRSDIPVAFVIKQTYLGYSIVSHTERQDSESLVESLEFDDKPGITRLRYIYEFLILENNERKLTMGAAELRLIEEGTRLRGHYMTNSPTRGSADLRFVQRKTRGIDTFEAAQKAYQAHFGDAGAIPAAVAGSPADAPPQIQSATALRRKRRPHQSGKKT